MFWLRTHRVTTALWLMALLPLGVGLLDKGLNIFTVDPFHLPQDCQTLWFALNGFMSFIAAGQVLRSLLAFRSLWTRQELAVSRGIFFIVYGGMMGYWVRAFTHAPGVTIATPYLSIGLLFVIWGTARIPTRFAHRFEHRQEES